MVSRSARSVFSSVGFQAGLFSGGPLGRTSSVKTRRNITDCEYFLTSRMTCSYWMYCLAYNGRFVFSVESITNIQATSYAIPIAQLYFHATSDCHVFSCYMPSPVPMRCKGCVHGCLTLYYRLLQLLSCSATCSRLLFGSSGPCRKFSSQSWPFDVSQNCTRQPQCQRTFSSRTLVLMISFIVLPFVHFSVCRFAQSNAHLSVILVFLIYLRSSSPSFPIIRALFPRPENKPTAW